MLSDNQVHEASDLLFHHWQDGRCMTALPQRMRPSTRVEGYAIQALLDPQDRWAFVRLEDRRDQPGGAGPHRCRRPAGRPTAEGKGVQ
jgi:hypothetical protein